MLLLPVAAAVLHHLLEHQTPLLLEVLLERVLEGEGLVAVLAPEGVPRRVTDHVSLQLVLGLGPVRALGAGVGPGAVTGDLVLPELRAAGEAAPAADAATLGAGPAVDLAVEDEVVLGGELALALVTLEGPGVVDLPLVSLQYSKQAGLNTIAMRCPNPCSLNRSERRVFLCKQWSLVT